MIDWISARVRCAHALPINSGEVLSVLPDGTVEWCSQRSLAVAGSFESAIRVRTSRWSADPCTEIEISGNPCKFLQGHNLWGSDDLPGLLLALLEALVSHPALSLSPTPEDRASWRLGHYVLSRVDVTHSFALATRADVLSWLRAAEQTAHLSHRGRGQLVKGSTLYFGQHSRRWSLKLYSKGQEIESNEKHQPALRDLPHARAWADSILRAELVIRSLELKRLKLDTGAAWLPLDGVPFAPVELLTERLGGLTMTTIKTVSAQLLDSLRPALRVAVQAWETGADLRVSLPHRTFYKYRAELLPLGIDIATLRPREGANVIPMVRVLEAVPVGVPGWAQGTPLYFEPRRVA